MQWAWNEPPKKALPATAYRPDVPEPTWLEPTGEVPNGGGRWTRIHGLGTSGRAFALLPVKPGVGKGAYLDFKLPPGCAGRAVIQFLPDFALWPGLGLGVEVCFNDCPPRYVSVPRSNCQLGETDGVRCAAVQDNFIRVEVEIPTGASRLVVRAADPGVVIDRVGVRGRSMD